MSSSRQPPDAKQVFQHACRFMETDVELRILSKDDEALHAKFWFPSMVISAFASELFLKCLLLVKGTAPPKDHQLDKLYARLGQSTQQLVEESWSELMALRENDIKMAEAETERPISRNLSTALSECGDAFRLLRYVYEDPSKVRFYIPDLPIILRHVTARITGWEPE